jgi:hypothetical protein
MPIPSEEKSEFRARDRWLIFAFVSGPLAALSNLTVCYSLVPTACEKGTKALLHASTAVFLLVTVAGALLARHYYKTCEETEGVLWKERTRWVATMAMLLGIMSILVIVAMEIPNVILRSCD